MNWIYAKGIPIEAQYLYRKGLEMSAYGQPEKALLYFRQSVFLAPGYAKAQFEMGNCLARLGRYDEAYEKYKRAAEIDPLFVRKVPAACGLLQKRQIVTCRSGDQAFCSTG